MPTLGPTVYPLELSNGLPLRVAVLPGARTAAFSLRVAVGSRHDPPSLEGLSHFLEHMVFRGTGTHPDARSLSVAIESLGAPLDAAVLRDHSVYEMPVFPEKLGAALDLLAEMFREPTFADLAIERDVVLQELLDEVNEMGRSNDVDNVAMRALFPDDGLGGSIIGTRRSVRRLRAQDLRDHLRRYYTAGNMVLAVAGPLEPGDVRELAEQAFGWLSTEAAPALRPARPRSDLPAIALATDADSRADFDLCFLTAPADHPDATALGVLERLLDDGAASRLRARLCDDLGLAYEAGAEHELYTDIGLLRVAGAVAPPRLVEVVSETLHVLAELRDKTVPESELDRVRQRVHLDLLLTLESVETVASWLAELALYRPDATIGGAFARLLALGPADVQAVARRYLRRDRAQLAVVGQIGRRRRQLAALMSEL